MPYVCMVLFLRTIKLLFSRRGPSDLLIASEIDGQQAHSGKTRHP
uniref:Uncharacterized protein n=1 Tax=Anguilla anguilla TaxID=7936 RepID=A0A0E9W7G6_ANGAN